MAAAAAAAAVLPVGFRFRPTDEELVTHYLKAKIAGRVHPDLLLIPDVDLSTCEPWELPAKSVIKSADPEWFFFAPRDRKYPGGHRSNRSTAAGYWKATGKDRLIRSRPAGTLIGIKKTLVFHRGRAPRGHRTAWIMHEYRTTEPQFESGQNGSFVLYRLFNKQEEETPGSNSEETEQSMSPSTSSPCKPQNDGAVQAAIASMIKDETLPSDLSQLTATKIATDDADHSMAHLPTTVNDKEQTPAQGDAFMDVLAQLPDLQPEKRYDGFPNISSPMRPYTDHPFVGNVGEQDLAACLDSFFAEQDLQDLLPDPAYGKTDKHPTGNAESNPTAVITLTNHSNNKALLEDSWRKSDSDQVLLVQRADDTDATRCSSGINTLQTDTGDANHETRAQTNMVYDGAAQGSHLYSQFQLQAGFDPQMESQNSGAFCSASSWTPYPEHLLNTVAEPSRSGMINSEVFNVQGGWAEAPSMQLPDFVDPQQGTAARRIRLVCSVQRASASQPVLTPHLESEDEAGSCYGTGSSSNNHNEDYVNAASQTMAGELMHIQGRGDIPTQAGYSVEVTDKLQDLSFSEDILPHNKLPHGANLRQRLRQESAQTTQSAHEGLLLNSVPGEPSLEARRQRAPTGSAVQLLWLALLVMAPLLVLVGVWKSLNY